MRKPRRGRKKASADGRLRFVGHERGDMRHAAFAQGLEVVTAFERGDDAAAGMAVGRRNETSAEITSGLAAGEHVVTEGAYGLEDSVKVEPAK